MNTYQYKPVIIIVSIITIITGLLVICGWFFNSEVLRSVVEGLPSMKINTAICFILSGIVIFLLTQKPKAFGYIQIALPVIVILTGLISFLQDIFSFNTGIDEWLMQDNAARMAGYSSPGRMATTTGFCFLLLGLSFLFILSGKKNIKLAAQYALHIITLISVIATIGYLYNLPAFYKLSFLSSMALNTSILFFLLSVSASFINHSLGITGLFTGNKLGSIMARRLFPVIALAVLALGFLRLQLHWRNVINEDFGISLFVISFLLVTLLLISVTAKYLNTVDAKRSKAEESLKNFTKTENEQKLRLVMMALGDNVWEHDFITQQTFFSDTIHDLIGYKKEDTANNEKIWWESTFPEDLHLLKENDRKYKAGVIDRHLLEYRLFHKDGSLKWVLDRGVVIEKDSQGRPLKIVGTQTDITERKQAEASLNKIQKQFQSFMEHIPAMTWIVDNNSVYQFTNDLYLETFYNKDTQLAGMSFFELFPKDIAEQYKFNNDIVFETNKVLETIEPSVKKDGSKITLKVFKFPLHINEKITLLGGVAIDITDFIKAEETLRILNEQLASSNKELEQFAYVASHDLQEPLRMVSSFLQLLDKKYGSGLDETAKQYIHFAVDGAQRMKVLILDLLSFSRIGTEQQFNDTVDLNEVLDEVKLNLMTAITENNVIINAGPLPVIRANKQQIVQLFQNLTGNAIKYRSEQPPEINIGYTNDENEFRFYIRDNGIGIDRKYFEKIFIIFQRLHNKSEYSGTGVGLSICKKIVEKHGGTISIESAPGKGSTFYFSIPKNKPS